MRSWCILILRGSNGSAYDCLLCFGEMLCHISPKFETRAEGAMSEQGNILKARRKYLRIVVPLKWVVLSDTISTLQKGLEQRYVLSDDDKEIKGYEICFLSNAMDESGNE